MLALLALTLEDYIGESVKSMCLHLPIQRYLTNVISGARLRCPPWLLSG